MKRHSIFKKIQKPNAAPVNLRVDIPQSQFINKNNFTKTCLCSCKDEVSKVADGITRLERLASVQSNLIKKIARRIHLDSDADYKAPSSHLDNTFNRRIFPITTEEGLIELDQLLQDKSVHFQVVSKYSYINQHMCMYTRQSVNERLGCAKYISSSVYILETYYLISVINTGSMSFISNYR